MSARTRTKTCGTGRPWQRLSAVALAGMALSAAGARAELATVGPIDPAHGFPAYYQDTNGVVLDLCIPESLAQMDACGAAADAGAPLPPYTFPDNFLDEFFWFTAETEIAMPGGGDARLVQALEAAFSLEEVRDGDQISFGRVRIRIDTPVAGNYTVTYPYGSQFFPNVPVDDRAINFTADIGIGAPGDFTGALGSAIGPFLKPVDADGNLVPPVVIEGDTFLTDGTPTRVDGSPFGTNFFRICVDAIGGIDGQGNPCIETDLFTLTGKLHDGPIPSPLSILRSTYMRTSNAGQVDVFAKATAGINNPEPVLSFSAEGLIVPVPMAGPTADGLYWGQMLIAPDPAGDVLIPASVEVTNEADTPPTIKTRQVVDSVDIIQAIYDPATERLALVATSSDKTTPPTLAAIGLPNSATGIDELALFAAPNDPARAELSIVIGPVPPPEVTIRSSAGGLAISPVTVGDPEDIEVVVDTVEILRATYNPNTQRLIVVATSSNKEEPPTLVAMDVPGSATGVDVLEPFPSPTDPARARLSMRIGAVPPAEVTVRSSAGGTATLPVTLFVPEP